MTVSDRAAASAEALADTFAANPTFVTCRHDESDLTIDLAICADSPGGGIGSLGTVTLADHDLGYEKTRLQIVAIYPAEAENFSRAIGTCALTVAFGKWPLRWGAVHPDVLTLYGLSSTLHHFLYVPPFSWARGPQGLAVGDEKIEWLQAIPISEAERAYAEANGAAALEALLVEHTINVTDLNRSSVV